MSVARPTDRFAAARAVADAVLYEGYVLYPYRASAPKNQVRWQFGVLRPARVRARPTAPSAGRCRTECVVDPGADAGARRARPLPPGAAPRRSRRRRPTDRGSSRRPSSTSTASGSCRGTRRSSTRSTSPPVAAAPARPTRARDRSGSSAGADDGRGAARRVDGRVVGRVVRRREPVDAVRARSAPTGPTAPGVLVKVVGRPSRTPPTGRVPDAPRDEVAAATRSSRCTRCSPSTTARSSRCSTRPRTPRDAVGGCANDGTFPVLIGDDDDVMLVVADHPLRPPGGRAREPRRPLRRDRDRRDPRAPRAHADRRGEGRGARHRSPRGGDRRPLRRHGARACGPGCTARCASSVAPRPPEPRRPTSRAAAVVGARGRRRGRPVDRHRASSAASRSRTGTRVRLRPSRRADAHDMFLAGLDGDGRRRVPRRRRRDARRGHGRRRPGHRGAARWQGRYLYFHPDEVEPLVDSEVAP